MSMPSYSLVFYVLIGVWRIVGDAERDAVGENPFVGAVSAVEAHARNSGIGRPNGGASNSQREGE